MCHVTPLPQLDVSLTWQVVFAEVDQYFMNYSRQSFVRFDELDLRLLIYKWYRELCNRRHHTHNIIK